MGQYLPPEALEAWLAAATETLNLDASAVDIATVLDVAKHVAHEVARPAAPLSTFLLGLALGQSQGQEPAVDRARLTELADQLVQRAHRWADEHPDAG